MHLSLGEAGEGWEQTVAKAASVPPATSVLSPTECPLSSVSPLPQALNLGWFLLGFCFVLFLVVLQTKLGAWHGLGKPLGKGSAEPHSQPFRFFKLETGSQEAS